MNGKGGERKGGDIKSTDEVEVERKIARDGKFVSI
jgi:hypothetical protein